MYSAMIFDLDGVIVDTAKYHYLAWKKIADELGLRFNSTDNELLKGVSRQRSFEIILELNGRKESPEYIEKYCEIKNRYYLDYIERLVPEEVFPGVREFMEEARKSGIKTALGSASKNSRFILEKLGITDLFDAVVDGTKVSRAKPDPEVFLRGAQELQVPPQQCVVFEDSAAGITAAHAGGMKAVGVSNREVEQRCDYYISSFAGLNADVLLKKVAGG